MNKILLKSIIVLIIFNNYIFSNSLVIKDSNIKITLNTGEVTQSNINELHDWGFYIAQNKGLSYKVIKNIETESEIFVDSIEKILKDIIISQEGNLYILDFKNAKPPIVKSKIQPAFKNYTYVLNLNMTPDPIFQFQLQNTLSRNEYITSEISFSGGSYKKNNAYHKILSFSYGIGIQKIIKNNYCAVLLNYSASVDGLSTDNSTKFSKKGYPIGSYKAYSTYFSFKYKINNPKKKYIFNIGTNIHFSDKLESQSSYVTFNFGIGYKINTK